MSEEADNYIKSLSFYGLSTDEARIYYYLLKEPGTSALMLSKKLKIARTKIYRVIEKLIEKSFVIEQVEGYGKRFVAESPEKLMQIVKQKEDELNILKNTAPILINDLNNIEKISGKNSKILHYQGIEGLKQVTWNSTKAKDKLRIFELASNMEEFMPREFSERARKEFVKNQVKINQLTNYTEIHEHTEIKDLIKYWDIKYIAPNEFKINFEILIYNNVYTMYNFRNNDVFIVEIYNKELADMQRQIFDSFWKKAKPMSKINGQGKALLKNN